MTEETASLGIKSQVRADEPSYKLNIRDRYFATADGTAYYREPLKDGSGAIDTAFMNFWPELVQLKQVDDGFSPKDFITFRAYRNRRYEPPVDLEKKDLIGPQPHGRFSPGCRIFLGRGNALRCGELMQMQCEEAETTTVYAHTGWKIINGERVFLNGGHSVTAAGLTDRYLVELDPDLARCYRFISGNESRCHETVLGLMYEVAPDWLVVPSLAYIFLTPLNEMLRARGAEPTFSFYLIGKTGSYKSSWAKILLSFFGKLGYAETAPVTFLDTQNSIGRKLGLGADVPLLLDDRRPTNSAGDKARYEGIEKFVSSAIGDRAARGRLNADSTAKVSYIARCNLIVTAEEAFQNIGSSSIARSVSVEMEPDTVNFERLRELQDQAEKLNLTMQGYLRWIIRNYDALSGEVAGLLRKYREIFAGAGHARLATAFSQMLLGYCIFLRFMKEQGQIREKTANEMAKRAVAIFLEMCEQQSRKVESEKPTRLFVELLNQMLETGRVRLCDLRKQKAIDGQVINLQVPTTETIGYRDDQYIYLIKDPAYTEVVRFYSQSGNTFPSSAGALWRAFGEEGKLSPDPAGRRLDRRKAINGQQRWYIWLRADVLDNENETEMEDHEHDGD